MKNKGAKPNCDATSACRWKRRVVLFLLGVLALLSAAGLALRHDDLPPEVTRNFKPKELRQLRQAFRRAQWDYFRGCLHERRLKDLFKVSIPDLAFGKVEMIYPTLGFDDLPASRFTVLSSSHYSRQIACYELDRTTNGWKSGPVGYIGPVGRANSPARLTMPIWHSRVDTNFTN